MSFYSDMAKMAHGLLVAFGAPRELVLIRETPTGTSSAPGTPIRKECSVFGVVNADDLGSSVEGMILTNKRVVILSTFSLAGVAIAITPAVGDKMRFDDMVWAVDACIPVSPGGTPIIYKLQVST